MTAYHGSLEAYLKSIRAYPLLTREQEQELAQRAKQDPEAAEKLVVSNLRFVVKIANQYRGYGLRMTDLVQEGNIGLIKGVEKFDHLRKIRLCSYAVWWIRAYIQNHILRSWSLVKIGTTQAQRTLFFSLERTRRQIAKHLGEDAADDPVVLGEALKVKPEEVVSMRQRMGRDHSLDAPIGDEGDVTFLDLLAGREDPVDSQLERLEWLSTATKRLHRALSRLDPRERYIIERRKLADKPMTLAAIGARFGCSRERIRQLEMRAMKNLKQKIR